MRPCLPCVVLLVAAGAATAQNLVVNGDFDSDLSGWLIDPEVPPPAWENIDINGQAGSGAARVTNTSPQALDRIMPLKQCIPLTQPGQYRLVAHGRIPAGQGDGKLVVSYWLSLDNPDCPVFQGAQSIGGVFLTTIDGWQRFEQWTGSIVPSPVPPHAMLMVQLGVEKDDAGGSFTGYFDAVSVVGDPIFASGFD